MGRDDPQIPMDPPEFILALHSMTDAKYNILRNGIPYASRLILFFFFSISFTLFVMASNGGKLVARGACCR